MPPVSPRTNSTDLKALDFFSCEVVSRSNRSCSVALTRTSGGLELKMSRRLWEWQRQRNGHCEIARANRSVKRDCATNFGLELRSTYRMQKRMARTRRGWQTR